MVRLEDENGVQEIHRPEYETMAAFGSMCFIDDVEAIIKANNICNRYGIDTISAGAVIAFAIECYERGIITKQDADGIELTWNNTSAVMAMLKKIVKREGFGAILADGVKRAAEKIGHGAEECAIHVGGQEVGYQDPRFLPARGAGYICDPAPGKHTSSIVAVVVEVGVPQPLGPYPELQLPKVDLRDYGNKSLIYGISMKYQQAFVACGMCLFSLYVGGMPLVDFIAAATGWDFSPKELLITGERIATLRQMSSIREGIKPSEFQLPKRLSQPPSTGPLKDIRVDFDLLRKQCYEGMGWDSETGYPLQSRLVELGLANLESER